MSKISLKRIYIILAILFLLLMLNVHIEKYETTKQVVKSLDYTGWGLDKKDFVRVENGYKNIYCNVPSTYCQNRKDEPVCYEYVNNVVGDWRSEYIRFGSFGGSNTCTIEKIVKKWRISYG